jgi:hypothetical protein
MQKGIRTLTVHIDGFQSHTQVTATHTILYVQITEVMDGAHAHAVKTVDIYGRKEKNPEGGFRSPDDLWVFISEDDFVALLKDLYESRRLAKPVDLELYVDGEHITGVRLSRPTGVRRTGSA